MVRKRQPYGASLPRSRTTSTSCPFAFRDRRSFDLEAFAYRYTQEKLAWQRTFTSEPYLSPELLWLSQDASIRSRFPELFFRDAPATPSAPTSDRTPLDRALLVPSHVPELAVQPFELTAGWHTARGKLKLFESRMRDLARSKVASEVGSLVASAENSGEAMDEKGKLRLTHLVSRLHRFESRLRPSTQGLKGAELRAERRRKRGLMAEARHVVGNLRHKYEVQKMRAALDLLPALERYNTDLKRGELEKALRESVKVPAESSAAASP